MTLLSRTPQLFHRSLRPSCDLRFALACLAVPLCEVVRESEGCSIFARDEEGGMLGGMQGAALLLVTSLPPFPLPP